MRCSLKILSNISLKTNLNQSITNPQPLISNQTKIKIPAHKNKSKATHKFQTKEISGFTIWKRLNIATTLKSFLSFLKEFILWGRLL